MPKTLAMATAPVSERWTILTHSITAPTLPAPQDGSLAITFVKETIVDGNVKASETGGDSASAAAFYGVWIDAAERIAAAIAKGATAADALHDGLRDAMYAYLQRDGGPIPAEAT